jgi:polygalacturonase
MIRNLQLMPQFAVMFCLGVIIVIFLVGQGVIIIQRDNSLTWSSVTFTSTSDIVLNALDFGAIGDGITDDTLSLRNAIHTASKVIETEERKVTVLLPAGYTFSSGPLNLTSSLTLQVDGILRALTWNTTDWPQIPPLVSYGNSRDGPYLQYQAFLFASHGQDIRITGSGVVDGNGKPWWETFHKNRSLFSAGRPNLVQLVHCQNVEITGVTLNDAPFWCLHPVFCTDVHIHHIKIRSPMYSPNSDGIDPDSSQNVLIEHNDISCGDDGIAIKSGVCGESSPLQCDNFTAVSKETVNITIRKNIFRIGMGIALGSECSGGIRDVLIEDNLVGVCKPGHCEDGCCGWSIALHLKTTDTRGGHMRHIVFRNNTIYNTTAVILVEQDYQQKPDNTSDIRPTLIQDVLFQNNAARGTASSLQFLCSEHEPCKNISFVNNDFNAPVHCQNVHIRDQTGRDVCSPLQQNSPKIATEYNEKSVERG